MKYLIAIDIDDTLKHSDGTISEYTKKVIKQVKEKGHELVIFTARPRCYAKKISNDLEINNYLVSSNGSEIYDFINNKIIWKSYLPKKTIKAIYEYASNHDLRVVLTSKDKEYVSMYTRNDTQILINEKNRPSILNNNINQMMIIDHDKEKITNFLEKVKKEYDLNIFSCCFEEVREEFWFSMVSKDSSKGNALIKLANYLKNDNTIAIGNDENDISMFQEAKISVAVDNAPKYVKQFANEITTSNDEDGVALYLKSLIKNDN